MSEVEKQSYIYYQKALCDGTHIAYLVFDESRCIGTGGVSFFQVMPTYHNPSGNKAYIMNMYTNPEYRRKGIAYQTLDMLVKDAKRKGISAISLEATDMGRHRRRPDACLLPAEISRSDHRCAARVLPRR